MTHATESVNTTPAKCVSVLKISSRLRRDSFFSSIESRAARHCLLAAYAEEVEHGGGNGEEGGVEAVEHAAVSRQDIARVFDAQLAFQEALYEVAPGAEHADGKREAYPINQFHLPRAKGVDNDSCRDAEQSAADAAHPRLFRRYALEELGGKIAAQQAAAAVGARVARPKEDEDGERENPLEGRLPCHRIVAERQHVEHGEA